MELFTPRSLIAGRLTGGQGRAVPSAMQAAAAVLGTAQVALLCATDKDQVWYLAAPASEFATAMPRSLWQCTDHTARSLFGMRSRSDLMKLP